MTRDTTPAVWYFSLVDNHEFRERRAIGTGIARAVPVSILARSLYPMVRVDHDYGQEPVDTAIR